MENREMSISELAGWIGGISISWGGLLFGFIDFTHALAGLAQVIIAGAFGAAASFITTYYLKKIFKK